MRKRAVPPMVSVIIPTYNRAVFLKEALESVFSQRNVEIEVIVVDDGSLDETSAVIESYGRSVNYIYQPNAGVSAARNRGIEIARGRWLAFLDSDDFWLPDKLEIQLDWLERRPDIKICQTEELWIRNGRRHNPKKYHKKPSGHSFAVLLDRCLVSPSAVMIHRGLFREVGLFDETLPACEDYDLWLRIGCRYPIGLVDRPLIVKRGGHSDQLSSSVAALDRYRIAALVKLLRNEDLSAANRSLAFAALSRKCRVYGEGCLKRGRIEEGRWILSQPDVLAQEMGLLRKGHPEQSE